jgi:hypothetical protein
VGDSTSGNVYFYSPMTIAGSQSVTTDNKIVTFSGTVNATTSGVDSLTVNSGTAKTTFSSTIGATTPLGNLSITADSLSLGGNVYGTGTLTPSPYTAGTVMHVNDGNSTGWYLNGTEVGYIQPDWSGVVIGSTSNTGGITAGNTTWGNALTLVTGGNLTTTGAESMGASSLTLETGGNLTLGGNVTSTGTGTLTIEPLTAGTSIGVGGGAGNLSVTTADLGYISSQGWGNFTIGRSDGTGTITLPATIFASTGNTTFLESGSGNISLTGNVTGTGSTAFAFTGPTSLSGNVATGNQAISFNSAVTLGGNSSVNSGTGTTSFGSTINGNDNLTASAGTLSFGGAIGGSAPLAAVSLTSTSAVTLPAINAASLFAQTGGNLTLSGQLTASGAGTPVTLVAGQNFLNDVGSGVISLTGAGSPNWLIYSTNPASNTLDGLTANFDRYSCTYGGSCPTLGTGNGLLYSYTPTLTLTAANANITYGQAAPTTDGYTVSGYLSGADHSADTISGNMGVSTPYAQGNSVGNYNITGTSGTLTDALGYGFTFATDTNGLAVGKANLSVTAKNVSMTYADGTTLNGSTGFTTSGLLGGDTVTSATLATNATLSTSGNWNVGTWTIQPSAAQGTGLSNYTITYNYASTGLTVAQKSLAITGLSATNKQYDSTNADTAGGNATLSGLVSGLNNAGGTSDVVTLASGNASFTTPNAGTGKTVTFSGYSISGTDAGNYNLSQPASSTANITTAPLSVTAKNVSMTYADGTTLNGSTGFTTSGLLGGDTVTSATLSSNATLSTSGNWNVGTWNITPSAALGSGLSNYTITYNNAAIGLTVAQKSLAITGLSGTDKQYDSIDSDTASGNATLSGLVSGLNNGGGTSDAVTLASGNASFTTPNAGTGKTVTFSGYGISGTDAGNYNLSQPAASSANITVAPLTVAAKPVNMTYADGTLLNGTSGFTTSGLLGGDTVTSATLASNATLSGSGNWNVGTWNITPSAALGSGLSNYSITYATGIQTIGAKSVSISGILGGDKQYDSTTSDTLDTASGAITGKVAGDNLTISNGTGAFTTASVGTTKTVTATGFSLGGSDANDYSLSGQPSGLTANITTAPLTVTAKPVNMTYADGTTLNGTTGFTTSGLLGSDTVTSATLATSATLSGSGNWNVGTWAITPSAALGSGLSNYAITYATGVQTIGAKTLSISGVTANDKVYDATTAGTLSTGSALLGGAVSGDSVGLVTAGYSANFADANAGGGKAVTVTGMTLNGNDAGDYQLTQPSGLTARITPAALTATADNKSKSYGSGDPAFTYTTSGLQGSDTAGSVLTGSLSRNAGENVGTYAITQGTLAANANYTLSFVPGTLTITTANILAVAANNQNMTYGGAMPTRTYSYSGLVGGDTSSVFTGSLATNATTSSNAGNYNITLGSLSAGANYSINFTGATLTIGKAPLTVTANSGLSKVYGTLDPALTYSYSGLVNSDTASVFSGVLTRAGGQNVGAYAIGQGTLSAGGNYNISYAGASFTINPASLILTAKNVSMAYGDGTTLNGTTGFTESGLVSGDAVTSVSLASNATLSGSGNWNAGSWAITPSAALGTGLGNYTITYQTGTQTIAARTLTVSGLSGTNKGYDGTVYDSVSGTGSLTGKLSGDAVTLTDGSASFANPNAGTNKTVTFSGYGIGGADAGDYSLVQPASSTASIAQAVLTATLTGTAEKTYDGTTAAQLAAGNYQLSGVIGSDQVTLNDPSSGVYDTKNAGTGKTVTVSGLTLSGSGAANYQLVSSAASGAIGEIDPRTLTVSAAGGSKIYGQADPALAYSYSGLVAGDSDSVFSGSLGRTAGQNVGTYAITQGTLSAGANYVITVTGGTLTINPATLTVTAQNRSGTYGSALPSLLYSYAGLTNGDNASVLTGSLSTTASPSSNTGSYAINQGTLSAGANYAIAFTGARLTIDPALLTITADGITRTQGVGNPQLPFSYSGLVHGDTGRVITGALITGAIASSPVGGYAIAQGTLSAGDNYAINFIPGTLLVLPLAQNATLETNILTTLGQANNLINPAMVMDRTIASANLIYLGIGQINARNAQPSADGDIG